VLRKKDVQYCSLLDFFERFFGIDGSPRFVRARHNFIRSLAGYCVVCYILNLKDRHNGNILLNVKGHIMHIDYGFILGKGHSSLLCCLTLLPPATKLSRLTSTKPLRSHFTLLWCC
jgi:Phosphatidylinositol 3- and 4-kinase